MPNKTNWAARISVFVIVFIFVVSLFAITQFSSEEESGAIEISGYSFYINGNQYATDIELNGEKYTIGFSSNPEELTNVSVDDGVVDLLLNSSKVYISYNPNKLSSGEVYSAYQELARILEGYSKQVTLSFTEDSTPSNEEVPLKTCADSTVDAVVVELSYEEETKVVKEGSCVFISGKDSQELLHASSKLAMWLIGVEV